MTTPHETPWWTDLGDLDALAAQAAAAQAALARRTDALMALARRVGRKEA